MKKITAREFQHGFAKHTDTLKPGQSIAITKHGQVHVTVTRAGTRRRRPRNFAAEMAKAPYAADVGDRLVKNIHDETVFDPRWLVLLVVHTSADERNWGLANRFPAPYSLNPIHQLTLENALHRQLHESDPKLRQAALVALQDWRNRLAEQVFEVHAPDWLTAYRLALLWNLEDLGRPPTEPCCTWPWPRPNWRRIFSAWTKKCALAKAKGLHILPERI